MDKLRAFCQVFGLHPLTALALFAVDAMLFGEEVATLGAGWLISIPVGVVLGVAAILIQKYAFKDETGLAIGKGLLVGLVTAIPTALPALGLFPFAVFGAIKTMTTKQEPPAIPEAMNPRAMPDWR